MCEWAEVEQEFNSVVRYFQGAIVSLPSPSQSVLSPSRPVTVTGVGGAQYSLVGRTVIPQPPSPSPPLQTVGASPHDSPRKRRCDQGVTVTNYNYHDALQRLLLNVRPAKAYRA